MRSELYTKGYIMEVLIGVMVFFGIGYLLMLIGFIYAMYYGIRFFIDVYRVKRYNSGKSDILPKHPEQWNLVERS